MAYDEDLADRIRVAVQHQDGITEKPMFGGLAFLLRGNLAVAASGQGGLMVRVDPAGSAELVEATPAYRMVMRGREMDGWLRVDTEDLGTEADLVAWVARGTAYAGSLPPK